MLLLFTSSPFSFSQTLTENYVTTYTLLKPVQTETQAFALSYHYIPMDVTYADGLGRPIQTIQVKGSSNIKDIVVPIQYDAFGRQTKQYLPYVNTVSNGAYHPSAITEQTAFYTAPPSNVTGTNLPFAETQFEPSPLNRVTLQGFQGSDWAIGSGHEAKTHYLLNDANEIPIISLNSSGDLILQGSYIENTLFKTESLNEENQQTDTYTDLLGRTICSIAHNNVSDLLVTYNVYDDMGRLRVVLSPEAYERFMLAGYANAETEELYFEYQYDERNRMISKKIPGKQIEYMIYDNWDRVIFTQDGNRRLAEEWYYIKYDSLSRPVETGLYKHPGGCPTAAALQQQVNSLQMPVSSGAVLYDDVIDETNHNYQYTNYHATDRIIMEPQGTTGRFIVDANANYTFIAQILNFPEPEFCGPLTYSYYDDYDINDDNTADYTFNTAVNSASGVLAAGVTLVPSNYVNSLPTVFKARVLGTGTYLTTVTFYDKKGRPIQTQEDNYMGGKQIVSTDYTFSGKPVVIYTQHTSTGTTTPTVTILEKFTYDHRERLKNHTHKINNDPVHTISINSYNVIGQLQQKRHDANWQNTNYTYHIRGWLKKINDKDLSVEATDLFGMELYYEDGASPLFNGNISATTTQAKDGDGNLLGLNAYQYTYDQLNRLLNAVNTGLHNASEGPITYDNNGNILTLKRNGFTDVGVPGQIDNLTYHYYGNRLLAVDDPTVTTGYSEDYKDLIPYTSSADYVYDANGNMTLDKNAVKVIYNIHNLPDTVFFIGTAYEIIPNKFVAFKYDASGRKLKKRFVDQTSGIDKTYYYASQFYYTKASSSGPIELTEVLHSEGVIQRKATNVYSYYYHLTDHLGNVRVVYTKEGSNYSTISIKDYYPFGMEHRDGAVPNGSTSRFGFNGQEKDNEIFGVGNSYTAEFWQYDSRLGRRWNVDPITYPNQSAYSCFNNNPIYYVDPRGLKGTDWYEDENGILQWDANVSSQARMDELGIKGTYKGQTVSGSNQDGVHFEGDIFGFLTFSATLPTFTKNEVTPGPQWAKTFGNYYQSGGWLQEGDKSIDYGPWCPSAMGFQLNGSMGGIFTQGGGSVGLYMDNYGFRFYGGPSGGGGIKSPGPSLSFDFWAADYTGIGIPDPDKAWSGGSGSVTATAGFVHGGYSTNLPSGPGYNVYSLGVNTPGWGVEANAGYTFPVIGLDIRSRSTKQIVTVPKTTQTQPQVPYNSNKINSWNDFSREFNRWFGW